MHTITGVAALALAALVTAQTPPGFIPEITTNLLVTFNTSDGSTNAVSPPGERIPRADTANPPSVALASTSTAGQAVLLMVDVDVPRNNTRVPLLHWLASNVTLAQFTTQNGTQLVTASPPSDGGLAPYRQPSPPPGDIPHRYIFLLFPQPTDFSVPTSFDAVLESRVGFNYTDFIAQTGLTDGLAANYITVQNTTEGAGTTTYPSTGAALPGTATGGSGAVTGTGAAGNGSGSATGSNGPSGGPASTTSDGGSGTGGTGAAATSADAGGDGVKIEGGLAAVVGAAMAGTLGLFLVLG